MNIYFIENYVWLSDLLSDRIQLPLDKTFLVFCCYCLYRKRKNKKLKKKLDSNQKFANKHGRSRTKRTKTNGSLGRFNREFEDDNSETIIAYRVGDDPGESGRRTEPVYYISSDLRLEKLQVPNLNNTPDPPSSQQSRYKSNKFVNGKAPMLFTAKK